MTSENLRLSKKIMIVSSYAPPKLVGGALCLNYLFSKFQKDSYVLFTSWKNLDQAENSFENSVKLPCNYYFYDEKKIGIFRKIRKLFHKIKMGCDVIRNEKIDIILAITDKGHSFLTAYILSKLSGKSYCLYILDPYRQSDLSGFWKFFANIFEPLMFKQSLKIFVASKGLMDYYKSIYKGIDNYQVVIDNYHIINAPRVSFGQSPSVEIFKNSINQLVLH